MQMHRSHAERVDNLFRGICRQSIQSTDAVPEEQRVAHSEPAEFTILPLEVDGNATREDALCQYTAAVPLEEGYKHPVLQTVIGATKQMQILQLPSVLVIHLKRFQLVELPARKVNSRITFPETLKIPRECCVPDDGPPGPHGESAAHDRDPGPVFRLRGVVVHVSDDPRSIASGHYWSYLRKPDQDGGWRKFNDSNVIDVPDLPSTIFGGTVDGNAYMLFYERATRRQAPPRPGGFENPGCLCYRNSVLHQSLDEVQAALSEAQPESGSLGATLKDLCASYHGHGGGETLAQLAGSFQDAWNKAIPPATKGISWMQQNDVTEYFLRLLEQIVQIAAAQHGTHTAPRPGKRGRADMGEEDEEEEEGRDCAPSPTRRGGLGRSHLREPRRGTGKKAATVPAAAVVPEGRRTRPRRQASEKARRSFAALCGADGDEEGADEGEAEGEESDGSAATNSSEGASPPKRPRVARGTRGRRAGKPKAGKTRQKRTKHAAESNCDDDPINTPTFPLGARLQISRSSTFARPPHPTWRPPSGPREQKMLEGKPMRRETEFNGVYPSSAPQLFQYWDVSVRTGPVTGRRRFHGTTGRSSSQGASRSGTPPSPAPWRR